MMLFQWAVLSWSLAGLGAVLGLQIYTFPMKNQHFSFFFDFPMEKCIFGAVWGWSGGGLGAVLGWSRGGPDCPSPIE